MYMRLPREAKAESAVKLKRHGRELVGRRVRIWWEDDEAWYAGHVRSFNEVLGDFLIMYDDGDQRNESLNHPSLEWELLPEPRDIPPAAKQRAKPRVVLNPTLSLPATSSSNMALPPGWSRQAVKTPAGHTYCNRIRRANLGWSRPCAITTTPVIASRRTHRPLPWTGRSESSVSGRSMAGDKYGTHCARRQHCARNCAGSCERRGPATHAAAASSSSTVTAGAPNSTVAGSRAAHRG